MKGRESGTTATTKLELFRQLPMYLGILERKTVILIVETRALHGVIAVLKKKITVSVTQSDIRSGSTPEMELFVTYSLHVEGHPGLPQKYKMESFTKIINS